MSKSFKKIYPVLVLLLLIVGVSLGYGALTSNLTIIGTSNINNASWDVHWNNVQITNGSVTGTNVTTAAHILTGNTEVEYSITLGTPGDFYEFTVDAVNAGSIDAMIGSFSNKVYQSNGTTERTLPDYLTYTVTYSDGVSLAANHLLSANTTETYKVRVEFKTDINANQLPSTQDTLVFKFNVSYVQADSNAIPAVPAPVSFSTDSWATILRAAKTNNISAYSVGDTKTVDMGAFGTHTLRIANTTTPSECSTTGFSQTACGFVLEFADIITTHRMNPYTYGDPNLDGSTVNGTGNKGGWPASEMRTYVNTDIYNALPTELKNGIINTSVVSGHGYTTGETNFTSTDKLYLLSTMEVWGSNQGGDDTATNETRQLDYYSNIGVTTSSYSGAKKQINGSNFSWWLRSAYYYFTYGFFTVQSIGISYCTTANDDYGVAPAFRIA